jgi:hypothetical protein
VDIKTLNEISEAIGVELKVRDTDALIVDTLAKLADREEVKRNRTRVVPTIKRKLTPEQQRERMGRLD